MPTTGEAIGYIKALLRDADRSLASVTNFNADEAREHAAQLYTALLGESFGTPSLLAFADNGGTKKITFMMEINRRQFYLELERDTELYEPYVYKFTITSNRAAVLYQTSRTFLNTLLRDGNVASLRRQIAHHLRDTPIVPSTDPVYLENVAGELY